MSEVCRDTDVTDSPFPVYRDTTSLKSSVKCTEILNVDQMSCLVYRGADITDFTFEVVLSAPRSIIIVIIVTIIIIIIIIVVVVVVVVVIVINIIMMI